MPTRRSVLAAAVAAPFALASPGRAAALDQSETGVRFCLNMSTVRGQKLTVPEQIALAADTGYDGIEPWLRDIDAYVAGGGTLAELKHQIDDSGLRVESAIGFAKWIVEDDAERKAGLDQLRKDAATLAAIGGTHIAAPPIGAHQAEAAKVNLDAVAERFAAAIDVADTEGVLPQIEVWGFSPNLSKLAEVMYVATAVGDERVRVLPDIYHLYKGQNDYASVAMLPGRMVSCFHLNDIARRFTPDVAKDADRVYPGEGDMPIAHVLELMAASGFAGALSLELFNPAYWEQPAASVASRGLESMKRVAREAGLIG